jgi:methionyl-tRNA synthetase
VQQTGELEADADDHVEHFRFSRALECIAEVVQLCDRYIDKTAPWMLAKKPEKRHQLENVLYHIVHTLGTLVYFVYPFMPRTAREMAGQLGLEPQDDNKVLKWKDPELLPGIIIKKGSSLFPRVELPQLQGAKPVSDAPTSAQPTAAAPASAPVAQSPAPQAAVPPAQITIDEFAKIQLKTAKVLAAERVPKSEKLLKLQVSLGTEQRQIVAGIGKKYEPESLVGKTIVIVANLKPAKLMGIESQGMVLAAGDSEVRGLVTILEEVDPGTKVK